MNHKDKTKNQRIPFSQSNRICNLTKERVRRPEEHPEVKDLNNNLLAVNYVDSNLIELKKNHKFKRQQKCVQMIHKFE